MTKNEALMSVGTLIDWLRDYRDLSETIVTNEELEALDYLYNTIFTNQTYHYERRIYRPK